MKPLHERLKALLPPRGPLSLLIASAQILNGGTVKAQSPTVVAPAPTSASASALTLELPVLVVDHEHRPVDDIPADKIRVKTGTGESFTPSSVRREGEDPVSLAILIDASRDSFHDLSRLDGELASLVGAELLPKDRITLYAADRAMTRSLNNEPPDAAVIRKGVADAMNAPTLHGGKTHSACAKTFTLWDDIAVAISGLSHAPGRRVLFVISSGEDGASKYDWLTVQQYAFDQGVAIFALRDQRQSQADDFTRNSLTTTHGTPGASVSFAPPPATRSVNNLEMLCANAGGLTLSSSPEFRKDGIADILFLIRKRFILTIPKEAYQPGATHRAKVSESGASPFFFSATGAREPLAVK